MKDNLNHDSKIVTVDFKEAQNILGLSKGTMLKFEKQNKIKFTRLGRKKRYLIKHLVEIQIKGLK